ncbi:uncharacterized protein [Amphiura filiformis]|uniref:uncharacterized protein n=1 Tax=Amphiura filiformis TaxID=82378 RepID=UPI003B21589F
MTINDNFDASQSNAGQLNATMTMESNKEPMKRFESSKLEEPKRWMKRFAEPCSSYTRESSEATTSTGKSRKEIHNHDNSQAQLGVLYKGKLPEHGKNLSSNPRNSKKHQRSYPSKDEQELANLMNSASSSASLQYSHQLRKALSDHIEAYEIVDQSVDLEKKLSAEICKEKEINQSLRQFKVGSEARKSERRLSIATNRTSLHVIPEHNDEPANPEIYQYSDTNLYF